MAYLIFCIVFSVSCSKLSSVCSMEQNNDSMLEYKLESNFETIKLSRHKPHTTPDSAFILQSHNSHPVSSHIRKFLNNLRRKRSIPLFGFLCFGSLTVVGEYLKLEYSECFDGHLLDIVESPDSILYYDEVSHDIILNSDYANQDLEINKMKSDYIEHYWKINEMKSDYIEHLLTDEGLGEKDFNPYENEHIPLLSYNHTTNYDSQFVEVRNDGSISHLLPYNATLNKHWKFNLQTKGYLLPNLSSLDSYEGSHLFKNISKNRKNNMKNNDPSHDITYNRNKSFILPQDLIKQYVFSGDNISILLKTNSPAIIFRMWNRNSGNVFGLDRNTLQMKFTYTKADPDYCYDLYTNYSTKQNLSLLYSCYKVVNRPVSYILTTKKCKKIFSIKLCDLRIFWLIWFLDYLRIPLMFFCCGYIGLCCCVCFGPCNTRQYVDIADTEAWVNPHEQAIEMVQINDVEHDNFD